MNLEITLKSLLSGPDLYKFVTEEDLINFFKFADDSDIYNALTHLGPSRPVEIQPSLISFIRNEAPRLCAISLRVFRKGEGLFEAMRFFERNKIGDAQANLPIPPPDTAQHPLAVLDSSLWDRESIQRFNSSQVLDIRDDTPIDLMAKEIAPFVSSEILGRGSFGKVKKVEIHPQYIKFTGKRLGVDIPKYFAVKELSILKTNEDRPTFEGKWLREATEMRRMNGFGNDHVVKLYTAFSLGGRLDPQNSGQHEVKYCLLMEYADGGDLQAFWKAEPRPSNTPELVRAVIEQLAGLAGAISEAHYSVSGTGHTRHGDIKPTNILRFLEGRDPKSLGRLKLGDWGLARHHEIATRDRQNSTETQHATMRYEAPERETVKRGDPLSRLYDVWGLGCIALEFVLWLVKAEEPCQSLLPFTEDKSSSFYIFKRGSPAKVHPDVKNCMVGLEGSCVPGSPLGDLLKLVRERLLVVELPPNHADEAAMSYPSPSSDSGGGQHGASSFRADAREMHMELVNILRKHYRQDDDVEMQLFVRGGAPVPPSPDVKMTDVDVKQRTDYRPPRFSPDWKVEDDEQFAAQVFRSMRNPSGGHLNGYLPTKEMEEHETLCVRCEYLTSELQSGKAREKTYVAGRLPDNCPLCPMFDWGNLQRDAKVDFVLDKGLICRVSEGGQYVPALAVRRQPGRSFFSKLKPGLHAIPRGGSDAHLKIIKEWLTLCDADHAGTCSGHPAAANGKLPKRLIKITKEPGDKEFNFKLRLVITEGNVIPDAKWVALSYRWGGKEHEPYFATDTRNHTEYLQAIPWENVPQTFKDAVKVTHATGVEYLWIDSLCIIQEGADKDFATEAASMEETVFSSAHFVIAATRATSQKCGFLQDDRSSNSLSLDRISFSTPVDDFQGDVLDSDMAKRGWVFQEHALARRTVFFAEKQTYFQCGDGVRCETLGKISNEKARLMGDPAFPRILFNASLGERILRFQDLFKRYSRLAFNYETDREVAILGLETRLRRELGVSGGLGLLVEAHDEPKKRGLLRRSLLWHRKEAGDGGPGCKEMKRIPEMLERGDLAVPSWSWMRYMGEIDYLQIEYNGTDWSEVRSPWSVNVGANGSGTCGMQTLPDIGYTGKDGDETKFLHAWAYEMEIPANGETKLVFDDGRAAASNNCLDGVLAVLLGVQRKDKKHFVLLVKPKKEVKPKEECLGDQEIYYERIGAGYVPKEGIKYVTTKAVRVY